MKKYILDLDIEADARLLSERLNICQEAIDYFRASSSLLKAGVKAGLTLYDIAVLCCRNDDRAEVPSMLEKLFDMASDLAYVAIENDRWHHSAASRALVEQLTPQSTRRATMAHATADSTPTRSWIPKSVSSSEFFRKTTPVSSMMSHAIAECEPERAPGMAQSSASSDDSSLEANDAADESEREEQTLCEVWAASVIMDVSVDIPDTPMGRAYRSASVSSDGSNDDSESSPRGFWCRRPTSCSPVNFNDVSTNWDDTSLEPTDNDVYQLDTSTDLMPPPEMLRKKERFLRVSSVTFAEALDDIPSEDFRHYVGEKRPSIASGMSSLCKVDLDGNDRQEIDYKSQLFHRAESGAFSSKSFGGMSRSKSYSALSGTTRAEAKNSVSRSAKASRHVEDLAEDYDTYRKYFIKFIDLVIVRETTAALHHSKHGGTIRLP
jgi:hypothetical protein